MPAISVGQPVGNMVNAFVFRFNLVVESGVLFAMDSQLTQSDISISPSNEVKSTHFFRMASRSPLNGHFTYKSDPATT